MSTPEKVQPRAEETLVQWLMYALRAYRKFFGEDCHGTEKQCRALIELHRDVWEGIVAEREAQQVAAPEGLRKALAKLKQDFYAESIKSCMEASQTAVGFQDEHNGYCRGKQAAYEECSDRVDELLAPLPAPPSRQTNGADEVVEACAQYAEKCFSDVAEKGTCDYIAEGLRKTFKGTFTLADDERRRIAETALLQHQYLEAFGGTCSCGLENLTREQYARHVAEFLSESRKEPRA